MWSAPFLCVIGWTMSPWNSQLRSTTTLEGTRICIWNQKAKRWWRVLTLYDCCPHWKDDNGTHTHTQWCEDTQGRWFSRSQRWNSLEEMNQPTLGSWPSSLQHGKMVHFHSEATQYVALCWRRLQHACPCTAHSPEQWRAAGESYAIRQVTMIVYCQPTLNVQSGLEILLPSGQPTRPLPPWPFLTLWLFISPNTPAFCLLFSLNSIITLLHNPQRLSRRPFSVLPSIYDPKCTSFFPSLDSTFLKPLLFLKFLHLHQFIPSTVEKVPKSSLGYLNISL